MTRTMSQPLNVCTYSPKSHRDRSSIKVLFCYLFKSMRNVCLQIDELQWRTINSFFRNSLRYLRQIAFNIVQRHWSDLWNCGRAVKKRRVSKIRCYLISDSANSISAMVTADLFILPHQIYVYLGVGVVSLYACKIGKFMKSHDECKQWASIFWIKLLRTFPRIRSDIQFQFNYTFYPFWNVMLI